MGRLQRLLDHQKRFVRDSAHQLRTPLAVLKAQVQSARRGDLPADQALAEINATVDRATALANQMLALAKVEQLRQQPESETLDWAEVARQVALELAPLIADQALEFDFDARPTRVRAHRWMLQELTRNLLHNAIKHSPRGTCLWLSVAPLGGAAVLDVRDQGPGISAELRQRLFAPFAAGDAMSGSGLGLTICREIAQALGGTIVLVNRPATSGPANDSNDSNDSNNSHRRAGLTVTVRLPVDNSPHGD